MQREGSEDNLEAPKQRVGGEDWQPSGSLGMNEELIIYHSELQIFEHEGLV